MDKIDNFENDENEELEEPEDSEVKKEIECYGKTIKTKYYDETLTDEDCDKIREEFYAKPDYKDVVKEVHGLIKGSSKNKNINNYFVRDLMFDVKRHSNWITINQFMKLNDMIRVAAAKIKRKPVFYDLRNSLAHNINQYFRVGGSEASKIGNYPVQSVKEILSVYNINNRYYDYSCGWGGRIAGALSLGVEYYGTDPNYIGMEKLKELAEIFNQFKPVKYDIRVQGSEIFVPEWENKMGLAFSSPPYFNLEEYVVGDQSTANRDYDKWLSEYWDGTVKNIKSYLIPEGYFLLNMKGYGKYDLVGDMKKIAEDNGFIHTHDEKLVNITRATVEHLENTNDEVIMVFRKAGYKTNPHIKEIIDEW